MLSSLQLFLFGLDQTISIITIVAAAVVLLALIVVIIIGRRSSNKKRVNREVKNQTYVKDGQKFTYSDALTNADGTMRVTKTEEDRVLKAGKTYRALKNGHILPGKYKVLSASGSDETFMIRLGNFARVFKHGDEIVIAHGQEIKAVSHTVVLR